MNNIVIIGASSSVGEAMIAKFRSAEYNIAATYHGNNQIASDEKVIPLPLDLTDNKSITDFLNQIKNSMTHIDTAIFLSGICPGNSLLEYNSLKVEEVMSVNFTGQAKIIIKILPLLRPGSQIIMFSSISAQKGSYDAVYAASKGAVLSFVKSLASTLPKGVRINAVAPGLIEDSAMFNEMAPERRKHHGELIPTGRFLQLSDLANVVYDLCQSHWAHLNGACIDLNGGQYVR